MQLSGKGAVGPRRGGLLALVVFALGLAGSPAAAASSVPATPTPASAPAASGVASGPGVATGAAGSVHLTRTTYRNPVSTSFADTYADPDVVRGPDGWWYGYATSDPLRSGEGRPHFIPMSTSPDLVHWQYAGDAFTSTTLPRWADAAHGAALWAPDVHYAGGRWRMYYVVTQTTVTPALNDNAIGMATAPTPLGPWTDSGAPVVGPRRGTNAADPNDWLSTYDPDVVRDVDGTEHIFYGSYYGGVSQQPLDASGRDTTGPATRIAIDNKFEGTYITRKGGYWYFFGSTANCCAGPTTGYSVEVARSRTLTGPYVDRYGLRIDVGGATGGTPVLYQNGNRWIGTGHNSMATDDAGRTWIVYHAIDRNVPYLTGTEGINRRPMLIDRLDWVNGWPLVRHGCGPSDSVQPGPTVRTGAARTASAAASGNAGFDCLEAPASTGPGRLDRAASDEFNGSSLVPGWQLLRSPDITLSGGSLNWPTERDDLVGSANTASVLLRNAPSGNWTVQTKLTLPLGTDEIRNFQQAGIIVYVNDDLFVRLDRVAIWNTRQSEFGKEMPYAGRLSYGGTIVGPPARTMWLRIVHRTNPRTGEHLLTPFTSRDGRAWTRGGTWTLPAGTALKIGLISQGANASDAPPPTASFDYFRVYRP
jgi:arabinan endo-1,5-alpha-L-arabinosidase